MMSSACMNDAAMPMVYSSNGWLSPRISFSREFVDVDGPLAAVESPSAGIAPVGASGSSSEKPDPEALGKEFLEFEFRLGDSVTMLPADELFSDGKLLPLQLATATLSAEPVSEIRSPQPVRSRRRAEVVDLDPFAVSPRAPRCSSRWRELLGLKRPNSPKPDPHKSSTATSDLSKSPAPKSVKHFLHRNPKSASTDSSLSLPLLRDSDSELMSISSRRSLSSSSSSSSSTDHDDLVRLSLDSDKLRLAPISMCRKPPKVLVSRPTARATEVNAARAGRSPVRRVPEAVALRGASVDSPRMNASGRVVFQGLDRSSSSPGSFIGGPRPRPRGMERSYSANVRVLNVPVCSLRGSGKSASVFGLGHLFSPQKKDSDGGSAAARSTTPQIKNERASRD